MFSKGEATTYWHPPKYATGSTETDSPCWIVSLREMFQTSAGRRGFQCRRRWRRSPRRGRTACGGRSTSASAWCRPGRQRRWSATRSTAARRSPPDDETRRRGLDSASDACPASNPTCEISTPRRTSAATTDDSFINQIVNEIWRKAASQSGRIFHRRLCTIRGGSMLYGALSKISRLCPPEWRTVRRQLFLLSPSLFGAPPSVP